MLCAVDEATVRSMLRQQFDYASDPKRSHEMYRDDAVLEFPQSGERFVGVENFSEWRSSYPASTSFEIREVRGRDDLWVVELVVGYGRRSVELRGQHPRVPRGQDRARDDLHLRGLGGTGVASAVGDRSIAESPRVGKALARRWAEPTVRLRNGAEGDPARRVSGDCRLP
jgi:hypothetical protein